MARLIIDTTSWSFFLRRRLPERLTSIELAVREQTRAAIDRDEAALLGMVRQEVLSGLAPRERFAYVRDILAALSDEPVASTDHERAAEMFNRCKAAGVQGSDVDYLICAVAERLSADILTLDRDFTRYAQLLPIRLHALS